MDGTVKLKAMSKYILVGITEYAEKHLNETDLQLLKSMIGCEVVESENRPTHCKGRYYVMPDGEDTHEDFLILNKQ